MKIYPEALQGHLEKQLAPIYLVFGNEPLVVQECCDLIRQRVKAAGCDEIVNWISLDPRLYRRIPVRGERGSRRARR